jgi:UDP-N-acetylmuramyl pentapeptide synthase
MKSEFIGGKVTVQTAWKTADIVAATRGKLLCGKMTRAFSGIAIDSRTVSRNELFIPVKGETHDGHLFIKMALDKASEDLSLKRINRDILRWQI